MRKEERSFFSILTPKIEGRPPGWQRVYGPVHYEHPALLRGSLIHGEYAGGNVLKSVEANHITAQEIQLHALHARRALITGVRIHGAEGVRDG